MSIFTSGVVTTPGHPLNGARFDWGHRLGFHGETQIVLYVRWQGETYALAEPEPPLPRPHSDWTALAQWHQRSDDLRRKMSERLEREIIGGEEPVVLL